MQTSERPPSLSVVVVTLGGRPYVPRCLNALLGQEQVQDLEILVPCDDRIADLPVLQKQFPTVRFLPIAGNCTYAQLRALGMRHARGDIVALTEDHCTPDPAWCARILATHAAPYAAVGGVIEKVPPDTALNWAIYLCDFSRYMRPLPEGPAEYLTDCNVSYKRAHLESISDVWSEEFHETLVHGALRERGESLWLSPHVIVYQQRSLALGPALRERYAFGRLFASTRVAVVSPWQRACYAAGSVVLWPLLVARVVRNVVHKHRHLGPCIRSLPAICLLTAVWVWGELLGYITGQPEGALQPGM